MVPPEKLKTKVQMGCRIFNVQSAEKETISEEEERELMTVGGRIKDAREVCYSEDVFDCEAGVARAVRTRKAVAGTKWRYMVLLLVNRSTYSTEEKRHFYETYVRQVLLYGVEKWAMTGRVEDILRCDFRMFRCRAGMRRQNRMPSEEVTKRCGLKELYIWK